MGRLIELLILMGLAAMVSPQGLADMISHERAYECNPDPDCSAAAAGDLVADPLSCNSFYICQGPDSPSDIAIPCSDGNIFDETAVPPDPPCKVDDGNCVPLCGGTCNVVCNNTYDLVADFNDCGHYFLCLPGNMVSFSCPAETPYFDGAGCVATKASCCKPVCDLDVVCKEHPQEQIPDPTNCHGGIICVNETFPYPYPCSGGFIFDVVNNKCSESETECTDVCSDTTGATGAGAETTPAGGTTGAGETTPAGGVTTPAGGVTTPAGGTTGAGGSTVVTTTAGGTTSACLDSLDCSTANGIEFIARCTTCDASYFQCKSSSGSANVGNCSGDLVFNPDPLYPYCIRPENCPFHPGK